MGSFIIRRERITWPPPTLWPPAWQEAKSRLLEPTKPLPTAPAASAAPDGDAGQDPRVIPYGSKVLINGIVYTAEDCGSGVKGKHIDIFFDSHKAAKNYGVRNAEAYLVE